MALRSSTGSFRNGEHTPSSVGMFRDSEFMRKVDEECLRIREAEREAARRGELAE